MNYDVISKDLLNLWRPGLISLQQKYTKDEMLFAGQVAFSGIQLALWLLWLNSSKFKGWEIETDQRNYDFTSSDLEALPWYALTKLLTSQSAWVLIKGSGLADSSQLRTELQVSDMNQTLASIDAMGRVVMYGDAKETLADWGVFKSFESPLEIPLIQAERLIFEWPKWIEAALPLQPLIQQIIGEALQTDVTKGNLHMAFWHLAAGIWQQLQLEAIIKVGPFRTNSMFRRFQNNRFSGIMLIHGDHNAFWQICKSTTFS